MVQRCTYPKSEKFPRYGGAGITVCPPWLKFENFLADMGERPDGKTLDRINNAKVYSKETCRWATPKEQVAHRSPESFGAFQRKKTRCPAGHPYRGKNLRITREGGRKCKTCERDRARAVRAARRAELEAQ